MESPGTSSAVADISLGEEPWSVPRGASVVLPTPTATYSVHCVGGPGVDLQSLVIPETTEGCDCTDCQPLTCPCFRRATSSEISRQPARKRRRLGTKKDDESCFEEPMSEEPSFECHAGCCCNIGSCCNRDTQSGLAVKVSVEATTSSGWGLFARQKIDCGSFVVSYNGEVLTMKEAKFRMLTAKEVHGHSNYILVLKEHSAKAVYKTHIDAEYIANCARYINHSCDPNLEIVPTRGRHFVPVAALYARRDISVGEELSFSYGVGLSAQELEQLSEEDQKRFKQCHCGASSCKGFLPCDLSV